MTQLAYMVFSVLMTLSLERQEAVRDIVILHHCAQYIDAPCFMETQIFVFSVEILIIAINSQDDAERWYQFSNAKSEDGDIMCNMDRLRRTAGNGRTFGLFTW